MTIDSAFIDTLYAYTLVHELRIIQITGTAIHDCYD